jgi:glycine/D-amino acid oxidase-like deaminating enzyme
MLNSRCGRPHHRAPASGIQTYFMPHANTHQSWGQTPWKIDFTPPKRPLPEAVDFAIVGGGFAGLAAAAWLRLRAPGKSVALVEAGGIGAGASGRTGGMVLSETAAGDLSGLGDVLGGLKKILRKLDVESELSLPGAWEIARSDKAERSDNGRPWRGPSPIDWQDSGNLHVISMVPGGTLHPGKQLSRLARAAVRLGAIVKENREVRRIRWTDMPELELACGRVRARKILLATNALSLGLSGLRAQVHPKLTLAARTAPISERQIERIGLAARKPFYTVDFPYLWGRVCADNSIVWGAGLVDPPQPDALEDIDVAKDRPAAMFATLEKRIHGLHPALAPAKFTHTWGGPIAFRNNWKPVFCPHPENHNGIVLGIFAGHGVALSVYLGAWAAEVMLGERRLPPWGKLPAK